MTSSGAFCILVQLSLVLPCEALKIVLQFPLVMAEKQFIEMRGEVLEALPAGSFRVKLENDQEVIGHLAGKLRKNRIRVLPGDDVKVEISPYDLTKARITFRF